MVDFKKLESCVSGFIILFDIFDQDSLILRISLVNPVENPFLSNNATVVFI